MALLAGEHTTNYHRKPADREYLYFALVLIGLLLIAGVQIGLSSQTQTGAMPIDTDDTTPTATQ